MNGRVRDVGEVRKPNVRRGNSFLESGIKEGTFHVEVLNFPALRGSHGEENTDELNARHRSVQFAEVELVVFTVSSCNYTANRPVVRLRCTST